MPKPFNKLTAIAAPIMRGNIDTDVIIRIERLVGNSIRGTLGDAVHPVRVDLLLKCSASKFADQFAFQFVIANRSPDPVEVVWDQLRDLQRRLATEGYGVRVYIPFGPEWYPYFMRRLAELPANVLFLAKNFFKN